MVLSVALSLIVKFKVDPNIEDVARIKAQVVVSRTVNKALSEHFKEDDSDIKTEFETQGINQTKYKIYIVLKCKVKVVAPFASKTFTTKNTVLVAEAVILGKVPDSYVEVPEEDILDVT